MLLEFQNQHLLYQIPSSESPNDDATGVSKSTSTLSIDINEPDGDPLEWTIETSPDVGSDSGTGESNGTKTCSVSGLDYSTTYRWYVNASDGTNWICLSYNFTVEDEAYEGPDFYVNTSGNDDNTGSLISPWATVQHAMDTVTAGHTVYIMEGTYLGYNTPWTGASSGDSTNWITYTNYENDTVILDGSNDDDACDGIFWFTDHHHIRITNLIIRNSSSAGLRFDGSDGPNTHNITIDNCTIYNCSLSGIYMYSTTSAYGYFEDMLVENNTIYDCQNGWNHETPSDETITMSNVTRFTIRNNLMYDNHRINIDAKNEVRDGYIYGNRINTTSVWIDAYGSSGIYVDAYDDHANNISIYRNIVWGNMTGYIMGTEQGGTLNNVSFYNNIYNGTGNTFQINNHTQVQGSHLKTDCSFINNIAGGDTSICFQLTDANSSFVNFTFRNNILNGSVGINIGSGQADLSYQNVDHNLFNVSTSLYWGDNEVNGSPCFVDPVNGDYSLLSNSPAVNTGSSVSAPPFDFNGVSRPQGSKVDIGAFEFEFISEDTTLPTISDISIITSNPLDTNVNFGWNNISCTVTDNVDVVEVSLNITYPDSTQSSLSMNNIEGTDQYYYNTSFSQYGSYSYYIWAKDTSGNQNSSNSYDFSMPPNWDVDMNGECKVFDLTFISNHYGETGVPGWIREDVDNNGEVKVFDLVLVSGHCGETWWT